MFPTLLGVPAYALSVATAIAVGVGIGVCCAQRLGVRVGSRRDLTVSLLAAATIGLGGAKLHSLLERGAVQPLMWELQNGYRYPGAVVTMLILLPLLARLRPLGAPLLDIGDAAAAAAGFAMAVVRLGCFLAGCCHGTVSALPWAIAFPAGGPAWVAQVRAGLMMPDAPAALAVHPLQLYFVLWSLALGCLLLWWAPRRAWRGQVLLLWLALDNLAKAALESLRDPPVAHLQWLSLAIGLVSTAVLAAKARKMRTAAFSTEPIGTAAL